MSAKVCLAPLEVPLNDVNHRRICGRARTEKRLRHSLFGFCHSTAFTDPAFGGLPSRAPELPHSLTIDIDPHLMIHLHPWYVQTVSTTGWLHTTTTRQVNRGWRRKITLLWSSSAVLQLGTSGLARCAPFIRSASVAVFSPPSPIVGLFDRWTECRRNDNLFVAIVRRRTLTGAQAYSSATYALVTGAGSTAVTLALRIDFRKSTKLATV